MGGQGVKLREMPIHPTGDLPIFIICYLDCLAASKQLDPRCGQQRLQEHTPPLAVMIDVCLTSLTVPNDQKNNIQ